LCCCEQATRTGLYLLDTLLTVCIIHQLVVFYWRGVWEILDVQLLPNDSHSSAIVCVIIACVLQLFVCLVELPANAICRSKQSSNIVLWALELFIFFFANLVGVCLWRGALLLLLLARDSMNKSPLKIREVAVGVLRHSRKFSGHP